MSSFSEYIVKTKAIRHNLLEYKRIDSKSKICAVVKANGYGIGAENVVNSVDDLVDFYAVACFVEAEKLRKITSKNILILNFVDKNDLKQCASKNISVSISTLADAKKIVKTDFNGRVKVHLAINTGMNRIGFCDLNEFCKTLSYISKNLHKICIEGIFTHLYNAKNFEDSKKQICIFNQYLKVLSKHFDISKIVKHTVASFGAVEYPEFRFDMVRLGILLYGGLEETTKLNLKQVVEIKSKIIKINELNTKSNVGYGKNIVKKNVKKIATIPLGYADGILRSLSGSGFVLINNTLCKIVGNVCMDMFMVDITNTNAKINDKVFVLNNELTLNKIATFANTISYEILTNIKKDRFDVKVI